MEKSKNNKNGPSLSYKAKKENKTNWIYETFVLPDPKTGEAHRVEAHIEHDFVLKCFFDPSILAIKTNIDSINSESQGRRYTADNFIMKADGGSYIDNKDRKSMKKPKNIKKFKELGKEYDDAKSKLLVVTEDQVRSGYLIPNLKKLYVYLSMPRPDDSTIDTIITRVESHTQITLKKLREILENEGIGMRPVWYCLAHKIILTNLEKYICNNSILWSKNDAV
jgi:hypothetical protein